MLRSNLSYRKREGTNKKDAGTTDHQFDEMLFPRLIIRLPMLQVIGVLNLYLFYLYYNIYSRGMQAVLLINTRVIAISTMPKRDIKPGLG